jgi:hypothetical protein
MSVVGTPRTAGLVSRAMNILLRPQAEWAVIDGESTSVQGLFLGYAAILAAIPPLAQIIHGLMPHCFFVACWTPNPVFVVVGAVVYYIASLATVFLVGFIIDALAPSFGAQKSQEQAMKVAVYSWTAAWVAGILNIIPWFGGLLVLLGSLYSIYLLYTGLMVVMKSPATQVVGYTAVAVLCGIVVSLIVGVVGNSISAIGVLSGAANSQVTSTTVRLGNGSSVNLGQAQQALQQMAQQAQAAQSAASGSPASGVNGAPVAPIVAVDPAKLKALLPDTVAGAPRTSLTSTSVGAAGLSGVDAVYSSGSTSVTVTITDLGAMGGLATLAGAVNVQSDQETTNGYDRVQTINGQLTKEQYDNPSKSGDYSIVVANRFSIEAKGSGVPMDTLHAAVAAVGPDRVAALAHG